MGDSSKDRDPRPFVPQIFCRACCSPLIQFSDWNKIDGRNWHVRLWCPECGYEREADLEQPHVSFLSLAIEEGFALVLESLAQLESGAFTKAFETELRQSSQTPEGPSR
jgi:hypothetical protein